MIKFKCLIIILLILSACSNNNDDYWTHTKHLGEKDYTITELQFDTIALSAIHTSGDLDICYDNNTFCVLDKHFGFVFEFDITGRFKERYLGRGNGPNELLSSLNYLQYGTKKIIYGGFSRYYVANEGWEELDKKLFTWITGRHTVDEVFDHPKPSMIEIYEPITYNNHPRVFCDSLLLIPIETSHKKFNGFRDKSYYTDSRIFGVASIATGNIKQVAGHLSPEYLNYEFLPNFAFFHFDTKENNIIVSYDIDSLIYVLNDEFNPINSFGFAGKNMNTQYIETKQYDEAEERFKTDRENCGFYNFIEVIDETGFTFRTYHKGKDMPDGLQIYNSEYNLIADINVPNGFKIIGYLNGYYFATYEERKTESEINILKFSLRL